MGATQSAADLGGKTHVVVGDGITAVAFIEHRQFAAGDQLIVLGRTATELGRGIAYAKGPADVPWRYAYLLNSPADDIDPDFAVWLGAQWDQVAATMAGRSPDWLAAAEPLVAAGDVYGLNAPREFYGDFVEEGVSDLLADLRARGVTVIQKNLSVVDIDRRGEALVVTTETGEDIRADRVDVAPGGPETLRLPGDDGPFAVPSLFGNEDTVAAHIKAGAEIFCIGGNAAMLDTLRLCQSLIPEQDIRFVACAPDGEVPAPLVPRLPRKLTTPEVSEGHATAESFLAELREAIDRAEAAGDAMREIRAGFRAHFLETGLSRYVTDPGEARKVPGTLRFWLRGGTRDTILDMHRLIGSGEARMLTGMVLGIDHGAAGAVVTLRDADGSERKVETGFVVNCAGAGATSRHDPLTEAMLAKGWLTRCPISRGLEVGPGCAAGLEGVRYLSPSVTVIGGEALAMPLYDAHLLRAYVRRASALSSAATDATE